MSNSVSYRVVVSSLLVFISAVVAPVFVPTAMAIENRPPEASVSVEQLYCRGGYVVIRVKGTDPDGDRLVYTIDPAGNDLPESLTLETRSGRIEGILRRSDSEGSSTGYEIVVVVTDPGGLSDSVKVDLFSIACDEPVISRFVLVDSKHDRDVRVLRDGDIIKLGWLKGRFSVRVESFIFTPKLSQFRTVEDVQQLQQRCTFRPQQARPDRVDRTAPAARGSHPQRSFPDRADSCSPDPPAAPGPPR